MYQTLLGEVRPAGRGRLQLERIAEPVHAGQGGDVARRHRLRAAARGPDQVAHRRQGRLRRHAARARSSRSSALFADGEGISTFSKKKGPAWFYMQWASNKANQTRMLQAAAGAPVRNSAYAAAQASADFKVPKEWVECMLTSAAIAQPGLPVIAPVTEFRDIVRHGAHQHDQRRRSGDRAEEGDGRVPAGAGQEREGLTRSPATRPAGRPAEAGPPRSARCGDSTADATAARRRRRRSSRGGGATCAGSSCRRWSSSAR